MDHAVSERAQHLGSRETENLDALVSKGKEFLSNGRISEARAIFIEVRNRGDCRGNVYLNKIAESNEPKYKVVNNWGDGCVTGDRYRIQ